MWFLAVTLALAATKGASSGTYCGTKNENCDAYQVISSSQSKYFGGTTSEITEFSCVVMIPQSLDEAGRTADYIFLGRENSSVPFTNETTTLIAGSSPDSDSVTVFFPQYNASVEEVVLYSDYVSCDILGVGAGPDGDVLWYYEDATPAQKETCWSTYKNITMANNYTAYPAESCSIP
ncbi:uncharacterized protein LOC142590497 [Dermacentor variabilis]|uniref:uncharacterized protein LOC142590497 n=1 Tax=Dermacentor variabilis TaxID=34621 RepID=UPI003F5C77FA